MCISKFTIYQIFLIWDCMKLDILTVTTESQTPNFQARYDDFLSYTSDMDAHSIHFFDESSVIKTTGK